MTFNVALLQLNAFGLDQAKNLSKGLNACREAKEKGADLALFPEIWQTGFTLCPANLSERANWESQAIGVESDFMRSFQNLAKELKLAIAVTFLQKTNSKPKNSVVVIDQSGEIILTYSKVFLCNFGTEELEKIKPNLEDIGCDYNNDPGDTFPVAELKTSKGSVKVGSVICADREFPEAMSTLYYNGAEIILIPNCSGWEHVRDAQLKARAFENFAGVAMCNYPKPTADGQSIAYDCVAWDHNGQSIDTLVAKAGEDEEILIANFDIEKIRSFKEMEKWRLDHRSKWQLVKKQ